MTTLADMPMLRQAQVAALLDWEQMGSHVKTEDPVHPSCNAHGCNAYEYKHANSSNRHTLQTEQTNGDMYTTLPLDHGTSGDQGAQRLMPAAAKKMHLVSHQAGP